MQKYVCQPTEPGHVFPYCVAMFNLEKNEYVPLKGEEYPTYEEAARRADELNKEYQQECDEMTENNWLSQ